MGQILVRNVSDHALETFRKRAKARGTSLEQIIRELIEAHAPYTPQERAEAFKRLRDMTKGGPLAPMSLDEIREGLE